MMCLFIIEPEATKALANCDVLKSMEG